MQGRTLTSIPLAPPDVAFAALEVPGRYSTELLDAPHRDHCLKPGEVECGCGRQDTGPLTNGPCPLGDRVGTYTSAPTGGRGGVGAVDVHDHSWAFTAGVACVRQLMRAQLEHWHRSRQPRWCFPGRRQRRGMRRATEWGRRCRSNASARRQILQNVPRDRPK